MSWFRVESSIRTHPKIAKLARRLSVSVPHARGLITGLWAWACDTAPDGNLSAYDAEDLSFAAEWDGQPEDFLRALIDVRLLDEDEGGLHIHEWMERAEGFKAATRKANSRAKKPTSKPTSLDLFRDCPVTVPGQSAIVPSDRPTDGRTDGPTDDGASAPAATATDPDDFWIPVRGAIEPWQPRDHELIEWKATYKLVPVEEELRKMREWALSNPDKKPGLRTARHFVTSWLSREDRRLEEAARKEASSAAAKAATKNAADNSSGQGSAAHRNYSLPDTSGAAPPPEEVKALIAQLAQGKRISTGPPKETAKKVNDRRQELRKQSEQMGLEESRGQS